MDSNSSYERYKAELTKAASAIKKPYEVSQHALWIKAIVTEALLDKFAGMYTCRHGDRFGIGESLVNQCIEHALVTARRGAYEGELEKIAWQKGYEAARKEFAKATGLYTEDDIDC